MIWMLPLLRESFFLFLHFTLDPYLKMLSIKHGGIKYNFWVFGMTRPWIELSFPGPWVNALTIMLMSGIYLSLLYYMIALSQILSTLQIISHLVSHKPTKWDSDNQHCNNNNNDNIYIYIYICIYIYIYIYIRPPYGGWALWRRNLQLPLA